MKNSVILLSVLLVFSTLSHAGKDAKELTATCAACHGSQGISNNTAWPNLAGQKVDYLVKEMKAFKSGERVNALMSPELLADFSDEQLTEIAEYYAGLPRRKTNVVNVNEAGAHVRARCVSCHGMDGNTVTSLWPNLGGQQSAYLKKQLLDYKSGARQHPIMQVIANELSDQEIADVAEYYSQQ